MKKTSMSDWKNEILKDSELAEKFEKEKAIMKVISIFLTYRKENNLTQTELSKKLGTTQQAISRLEKNLINPSLEFLVNSLYEMGYEISINKIKK
ncbi:MAG: helix-turn-helix domain-containing protein [Cetobacterium sp.]|uniref:helix-turn-helix domain-containing protein n=1 Tax=Cetobacterium sp. TaxID=2071632 RepID=UPI003F3BFE17